MKEASPGGAFSFLDRGLPALQGHFLGAIFRQGKREPVHVCKDNDVSPRVDSGQGWGTETLKPSYQAWQPLGTVGRKTERDGWLWTLGGG